jgi:hypothetical protein
VGADAQSGNGRAGRAETPSASAVPAFAPSVFFCACFLPDRRGTHFYVQIIDLTTGHILDELPSRRLAELPAVLGQVVRGPRVP